MRFHCGISFSWRTIKKFLIPFLIGILGCLGFKWINDNKDNLPLGFINLTKPLQVNALSNYETRFDIDYSSYNSTYSEQVIDRNNVKLSDFVDNLKNNTNLTRNFLVMPHYSSGGSIYQLYIFVFDNNSNYTFNFYGNNYSNFIFLMTSSDSKWGYDIRVDSLPNDIYSTTFYNNFITCASGGSCSTSSNFDTKFKVFRSSSSITNDSNNFLSFITSSNDPYMLYYSSMPLHISNTYNIDNTKVFYKSIYIDNTSIDVGSDFLTYYDYTHPITPTPDPEPEPVPDSTEHKPLFNKIYWFDDNTTEIGILSSIYILLFLYCLTMLILRILTYIKNTRW